MSAIVVALLGFVVLHQVKQGLIQAKLRSSIAEEQLGISNARAQLTRSRAIAMCRQFSSRSCRRSALCRVGRDGGYEVVGCRTRHHHGLAHLAGAQQRTDRDQRADRSQRCRETGDKQYYYTYSRMLTKTGSRRPSLAIGSRQLPLPDNSTYQFYYLFSLAQQKQTLALVWRTLLFSGIALVMLLAGIAWLVTRQVVTPVRMAARIAERLADGRLQERMKPKGEDDLALLATSFNKMADSLQKQIRRLEELSRIQRRFVSDVSHELAHSAHNRAHGGRRVARSARRFRPGECTLGRTAANPTRPV